MLKNPESPLRVASIKKHTASTQDFLVSFGAQLAPSKQDHGQDALALSYNTKNTVHTFDVKEKLTEEQKQYKWKSRKIEFHEENLWNANVRKKWKDTLLSSQLIFVDLDPHDGYLEYELYSWLKRNKYKGILLFDDIHFPGMQMNLWSKIPDSDKHDITHLGHFSGTGMVLFPGYSAFEIVVQ